MAKANNNKATTPDNRKPEESTDNQNKNTVNNTKQAQQNNKKGQSNKKNKQVSFSDRLAEQARMADGIKTVILNDIENVPLDGPIFESASVEGKREKINFIYKLRNAISRIKFSGERDVENVIISSAKTKELIEECVKIDAIFNSITVQSQRISKSGDFEKMRDGIEAGIQVSEEVSQAIESLKETIANALRKGFGDRRSIEEQMKKDKQVVLNNAINDMSNGMMPSLVKEKHDLSDSDLSSVVSKSIDAYVISKKDEITKATIKKEKLHEIANSLGIKATQKLKQVIREWSETDAKLKKALDEISAEAQAQRESREAEAKEKSKTEPTTGTEVEEVAEAV